MKVLLITDGIYPFQLGGMQKHSLILTRLLADHHIKVHLVHCGGDLYDQQAFDDLFNAEQLRYIQETHIPFPKLDAFPGHYLRENKRYSNLIFKKIREEGENEYDLVYAQGFTGWEFIKQRKAGKWQAPVVVNFHGFEMFQKPPSIKVKAAYALLKSTVRTMIRQADFVYSFGGKIHPLLLQEGVKEEQLLLQSNGIDEWWLNDQIEPVGEIRKFIFVGRYERRKGIEELNQALELLSSSEIPFSMTFIGPIPEDKRVKDDRIHYVGEVRDESLMRQYLRQADCLICPSHSEGMPTVILEAMASGLAIIATDVGAVSRQVTTNGVLLSDPDVLLIKKAIESMCVVPAAKIEKLKQISVEMIQDHFLWQRIAEQKIADFNLIIKKQELAQ